MNGPLRLELTAEPASAMQARRAVTSWLFAVCGPSTRSGESQLCDTGYDLLLAVSEAVSNCIDHAYRDRSPGTIVVDGHVVRGCLTGDDAAGSTSRRCGGRQVHLTVADRGRWRSPPTDPGYRGRGLTMIEDLVESFELTRADPGTLVRLRQPLGRC